MKHEAISRRELARLVHLLKEQGTFQGQRGERQVTMKLNRTLFGPEIAYSVCIARLPHSGTAKTVGQAVDEVNRIIKHSSAT